MTEWLKARGQSIKGMNIFEDICLMAIRRVLLGKKCREIRTEGLLSLGLINDARRKRNHPRRQREMDE